MEDIKKLLIELNIYTEDKIYSLDNESQEQILNTDVIPKDKQLLFLDHCHIYINKLLMEANLL